MDERYSEVGMFGAIANAIADLKHEADRIAGTSEMKLSNTLTGGELQHILDYALKATKKLKTIRFTDENVLPQTIEFVNPYSNGRHHEIANVRVTTKDGLLYEPQWTASRGFHCVQ